MPSFTLNLISVKVSLHDIFKKTLKLILHPLTLPSSKFFISYDYFGINLKITCFSTESLLSSCFISMLRLTIGVFSSKFLTISHTHSIFNNLSFRALRIFIFSFTFTFVISAPVSPHDSHCDDGDGIRGKYCVDEPK